MSLFCPWKGATSILHENWNCPFFVEGEDGSQGGTGRNKQSQIPPGSRRCRCISKSLAKALEEADFSVRSLHTTGQDQQNLKGFSRLLAPGRSAFSLLLSSISQHEGRAWLPDHNDFSVCSPGAIRLLSMGDRLSPAMLLGISETMFRYTGYSTFNIRW